MKTKIKVWDWLLRLFHWALVIAIITSYLTIEVFDAIELHVISGIVIAALLTFRILWGFLGSNTSTFLSFFPTPQKIINYLKSPLSDKKNTVGHSALGSLSVFSLLCSLSLQVLSGLVIDDEIYTTGPLNKFVSSHVADLAAKVHDINIDILKALIILHLLAIIFYLVKNKINLITPMITGNKYVDRQSAAASFLLKMPHWIITSLILIASISVGFFLFTL